MSFWRATAIALWALWITLANLRTALSGRGMPPSVTLKWHRGVCRIAGIDLKTYGEAITDRPVLVVSNHVSYLDILVLAALLPCSFVSKAEVAGWPVFGWLARQQRTVFIERNARKAAHHLDNIKERLSEGGCLVLFPEGTSSDGSRVLKYRSSLFEAARTEVSTGPQAGREVEVQPVSIAYSRLDGIPMGRALRPFYAWYADMELGPHLLEWLGLGRVGVDVVFHPPVRLSDFGSRKALADHCQAATAHGLSAALRGREDKVAPPLEEGGMGLKVSHKGDIVLPSLTIHAQKARDAKTAS